MHIYEEALNNIMNTLCQRYMDLLAEGTITVDEYDTIMKPLFDSNKLLKQALERAKKVEELLYWYRESWKSMRDGCLESKINKLEKELEILK